MVELERPTSLDRLWPGYGVRTGRPRNIGAANLPVVVSLLVMLDSDLVLRPDAMSLFHETHREHPDAVLFGRGRSPDPSFAAPCSSPRRASRCRCARSGHCP
jgi:hypothetical protein